MKKFNVGVLGIGDISDVYIKNLKKYSIVSVVACAGRNLQKAQDKAAAHAIAKAYATPAELVADASVDIILNLTLPAVHAELNTIALEAGKHVYTEKPLAATFKEGEKLLAFAQKRGLSVGCAPDTFLGGRLQTCRQLIDEGQIGEVTGASAFVVSHGHEWFHPNPDFLYTADNYRWKSLPRQTPYSEWTEAPNERRFNETSHRENSRGIGLVDMAYAIRDRRPARASGTMALHCLEIMESLLASASEGRFYDLKSSCARPEPLPVDFPESES